MSKRQLPRSGGRGGRGSRTRASVTRAMRRMRATVRFGRIRRRRVAERLASHVTAIRNRREHLAFGARLQLLAPVTTRPIRFPELTYAAPSDPPLRRWMIRALEHLSGRGYFEPLYERWQADCVASGGPLMAPMMDICGVELRITQGIWPPPGLTRGPLVIVANHPYGILDGMGALTLAERLGRPFKVLIHKDLMKVKEVAHLCLPIDFTETREAQAANIRTRNEALQLLREGTTIVVFPAGGVATAPSIFGDAVDLPWKAFTARMIFSARAQVLPIYFEGQCSPLFHLVSKFSPTIRLAMMIREFRRRVNQPLNVRIGEVMPFESLQAAVGSDRKALTNLLFERVHELSGKPLAEIRDAACALPRWLKAPA